MLILQKVYKTPTYEKNLLKGKIIRRLARNETFSKNKIVYIFFRTFRWYYPACSRHKIDQEDINKTIFAQISNHMRCYIDALRNAGNTKRGLKIRCRKSHYQTARTGKCKPQFLSYMEIIRTFD